MDKLKEIENRYYKKCGIVVLPTKDKSNIIKANTSSLLWYDDRPANHKHHTYQHFYITSKDKPKEGDFVTDNNNIGKVFFNNSTGYSVMWGKNFNVGAGDYDYHTLKDTWKKIIATTDKLKIGQHTLKGNQGYAPISGDVVIDEYLPQPSQAFIQKYCEQGGTDKYLVEYKAFREGERPSAFVTKWNIKTDSHNTITIKPVNNFAGMNTYDEKNLED